jgi:hypothetical protein
MTMIVTGVPEEAAEKTDIELNTAYYYRAKCQNVPQQQFPMRPKAG